MTPATIPSRVPPKNARLTAIARVDMEEDDGGSDVPVEVVDWSGSVSCFVTDKRIYGAFAALEAVGEDADTEICIPWKIVRDFAPDFEVGFRLTTDRGKFRVVRWEDRRDFGFIRAFGVLLGAG